MSILTIEEWIEKAKELAEMAKLIYLIKEKWSNFVSTWKPLVDFMLKTEKKNEILLLGFGDYINFVGLYLLEM